MQLEKLTVISALVGFVIMTGCANVLSNDKNLAMNFLRQSVRERDEYFLKDLKEKEKKKDLQKLSSIDEFMKNDLVDVKSIDIKARPINVQNAIEASINHYNLTGEAEYLITGNNVILYPYGLSTPKLICAVLNPCSIELQEQEEIVDTHAGDTQRWWIGYSFSGGGESIKPHVIVKPLVDDVISTSLLITTNKRIYYIQLESVQDGEYTPRIGFYYPQDPIKKELKLSEYKYKVDSENQNAPPSFLETVKTLNTNYKIKGNHRKAWYPKSVFDNGRQTFIQMDESVMSSEAPVFVVLGSGGVYETVNYRFKDSFYIIDRIFQKGALVLNANGKEEKIKVYRK